jgi:hypothetical protein
LINLGFYGELFVLNLYLQRSRHYSALLAGLALLPQMGVVAAGSAASGRFTARAGSPRPTLLIGLLAGGAGLAGLVVAGGMLRSMIDIAVRRLPTSSVTALAVTIDPPIAAGARCSRTRRCGFTARAAAGMPPMPMPSLSWFWPGFS